jgi:hypothetical protein
MHPVAAAAAVAIDWVASVHEPLLLQRLHVQLVLLLLLMVQGDRLLLLLLLSLKILQLLLHRCHCHLQQTSIWRHTLLRTLSSIPCRHGCAPQQQPELTGLLQHSCKLLEAETGQLLLQLQLHRHT